MIKQKAFDKTSILPVRSAYLSPPWDLESVFPCLSSALSYQLVSLLESGDHEDLW